MFCFLYSSLKPKEIYFIASLNFVSLVSMDKISSHNQIVGGSQFWWPQNIISAFSR